MNNKMIDEIIVMLGTLNEEERLEVFNQFCTHCGSDNPYCQCWNDE